VIETINRTGEQAYTIGIVEKRAEGEKDIVIV